MKPPTSYSATIACLLLSLARPTPAPAIVGFDHSPFRKRLVQVHILRDLFKLTAGTRISWLTSYRVELDNDIHDYAINANLTTYQNHTEGILVRDPIWKTWNHFDSLHGQLQMVFVKDLKVHDAQHVEWDVTLWIELQWRENFDARTASIVTGKGYGDYAPPTYILCRAEFDGYRVLDFLDGLDVSWNLTEVPD